jgi:hypothetical protein
MKTLEKAPQKITTKKATSSKILPKTGSYAALLEAAAFAKKVNLAKRYAS